MHCANKTMDYVPTTVNCHCFSFVLRCCMSTACRTKTCMNFVPTNAWLSKTAQDVGMVWVRRDPVWFDFHPYMCLFSVRKPFCVLFWLFLFVVSVQLHPRWKLQEIVAVCWVKVGGSFCLGVLPIAGVGGGLLLTRVLPIASKRVRPEICPPFVRVLPVNYHETLAFYFLCLAGSSAYPAPVSCGRYAY